MTAQRMPHIPTLEEARLMAKGYTQAHVWIDYLAVGGKATQGTMEDWMRGKRDPKVKEFARLCHVINNRLESEGKGRPLPDLPFLFRGDEDSFDLTGSYGSLTDARSRSLDGADLDGVAA
jgi:hypothetical protein